MTKLHISLLVGSIITFTGCGNQGSEADSGYEEVVVPELRSAENGDQLTMEKDGLRLVGVEDSQTPSCLLLSQLLPWRVTCGVEHRCSAGRARPCAAQMLAIQLFKTDGTA